MTRWTPERRRLYVRRYHGNPSRTKRLIALESRLRTARQMAQNLHATVVSFQRHELAWLRELSRLAVECDELRMRLDVEHDLSPYSRLPLHALDGLVDDLFSEG